LNDGFDNKIIRMNINMKIGKSMRSTQFFFLNWSFNILYKKN
jgi:hypothetical protein